jgi:hypothetical protein
MIEFRIMLRLLYVNLDGSTLMLGDNMSVDLNTLVISNGLKKKNNEIAYYLVREAIVATIKGLHISRVKKMPVPF